MNYKEQLYKRYRSTHNDHLQGPQSRAKIEGSFPVFDYYYLPLLPKDENARILDVGCGDGTYVYYLQNRGYKLAQGVDLSEEQIQLGRALGIDGLQLGSLEEFLGDKSETYDCIIAKDVIEHLTRQQVFEALLLITSALKKGGSFIMQVPNGQGLFHTSILYGDYTHEMAYTSQSVRQLFFNTGFSEVCCYPVNPFPKGIKGKLRSTLWKLKVAETRFWRMVESGNGRGIYTSNLIARGIK